MRAQQLTYENLERGIAAHDKDGKVHSGTLVSINLEDDVITLTLKTGEDQWLAFIVDPTDEISVE